MSFDDAEVCGRIEEKLHDMEWDENPHHKYCPMANSLRSTACFCDRLDAADKAAAAEFKADCLEDR